MLSNPRPSSMVTAIVDVWPHAPAQVERAAYSALAYADKVILAIPEALCHFTEAELRSLPGTARLLPFWGSFVSFRNELLGEVETPFVLFLGGDEELVTADASLLLQSLDAEHPEALRLNLVHRISGEVLAQPIRMLPLHRGIRYSGRIWPQVGGSLIEFGIGAKSLHVRITRPQDRPTTTEATHRLRRELLSATEAHVVSPVALAVLAWGENKTPEALKHLDSVSPGDHVAEALSTGLRSLILQETHHYRASQEVAKTALAGDPDRGDLWYLRGTSAWFDQAWAEAEKALTAAMRYLEPPLPYLEPGYASFNARLWRSRARVYLGAPVEAVRDLLGLLAQYPYFRPAWQEILTHLQGTAPNDTYEILAAVIPPSHIRQYFSRLTQMTAEETRLSQWMTGSIKNLEEKKDI